MYPKRLEFLFAADIVLIKTVPAVYDNISLLKKVAKPFYVAINRPACRKHKPDNTRRPKYTNQFLNGVCALYALFHSLFYRFRRTVIGNHLMPSLKQPPRHIHPHTSQANQDRKSTRLNSSHGYIS